MSELHWHAAGGPQHHTQSTLAGLKGTCGCGRRHTLARAAEDQICPGVAHTWPAGRPCVLCGLGWRVPGVLSAPAVQVAAPSQPGAGILTAEPRVIFSELVGPPPANCIYCAVLRNYPLELARHRVQVHKEVS